MIIIFAIQAGLSNQNSTPLNLNSNHLGTKLWNVLPIDINRSESLSIFKRGITAWRHSDASKALERKIFWSIHFCMLLHSLVDVADILYHSTALLCIIS